MHNTSNIVNFLGNIHFANAWVLLLLLLIPIFTGFYIWKRKDYFPTLTIASDKPFLQSGTNWKVKWNFIPFVLRMLTLCFTILALARPQSSISHKNVNVEGIDIVLALDVSASMTAMDFKPNRLEACKNVMNEFIEKRPNDHIGLVLYSGEAYTKCPLTSDHNTLLESLRTSKNGIIDDGTAIGDGLGTAINRLRESKAKSKVIILLSDGVNNAGYIDPISAAEIAKNHNIRVYTIGCGTLGQAPVSTPYGIMYTEVEIDESLLKQIAEKTGGNYFRAQNKNKLEEIYNEIDKLEKTRISETVFTNRNEEFLPFVSLALIFFLMEIVLRYTIFYIKP